MPGAHPAILKGPLSVGAGAPPADGKENEMRRHVALTGLAALLLTALPAAPASAHTYTYTVETRGGVSSDVGTFSAFARSTLEDSRGWSLGGATMIT